VSHKYVNDEEKRVGIRKCQRFYPIVIAFKRVTCNGAQHEEAWCMTDIAQRLLENAK
jgi:hypothetical protein